MNPDNGLGSLERRAEAARLTRLMETLSPFTYLRLGDGELALLIEWQQGLIPKSTKDRTSSSRPIFDAYGVNGLRQEDYGRLMRAYESCTYLDTWQRVTGKDFHRLRLARDPYRTECTKPSLSQICLEWAYYELPTYAKRHRCVIAGAEGKLLGELLTDARYQAVTNHFWNFPLNIRCVGIRDYGQQYWNSLDVIKQDLIKELSEFNADTLLLSLASGAKILCQEIATELNVKCFDLGSVLLALTYSATPGYSIARNSHNPFFFRVPLDAYIDCLMRAHPDLSMYTIVAKAQAQVCFDLLKKELMNSFVPEIHDKRNFDPSPDNLQAFRASNQEYHERFGSFLAETCEGRQLDLAFRDWCADYGLGSKRDQARRFVRKAALRLKRISAHLLGKK